MRPIDSVGQPEFRQSAFSIGLNGLRNNQSFSKFPYIFSIEQGLSGLLAD